MTRKLLSRDEFRNAVFARDGHACVFCGKTAEQTPEGKLDAHHIIERRLFTAPEEHGGYFIDNGATVCEDHHLECEQTKRSVDQVRDAAGITKIVIPAYFYDDAEYDKWGNVVMPNGQRLKGPLFYDESVQKVLAERLDLFSKYVKHPRLSHLPWSPGMNSDDRRIETLDAFLGQNVWVTEKADGEQSSIYNDHYHARSLDTDPHESRSRLKAFASQWQHGLADDERVCGENVFAQHSIVYDAANPLPHFFLGFSMWRRDLCLSVDETLENFAILGVTPVRTLYRGVWDEKVIRALYNEDTDWGSREGYVVRLAGSFSYSEFRRSVAKYVRKGHVQTAKHHWKAQKVIPNFVEALHGG
jgi:hypothetical protein